MYRTQNMATGMPIAEAGNGLQHGAAHDRSDDPAARRSQRHADADLRRAPHYGIRCDAIKADGREQQGQQPKRSETRNQALLYEAVVNSLLEGLKFNDQIEQYE